MKYSISICTEADCDEKATCTIKLAKLTDYCDKHAEMHERERIQYRDAVIRRIRRDI